MAIGVGKTESIIVKLIGKDQFSKVFGSAEKKMGNFRKNLNKFGAVGLAAGGAFAVGIGVKAVGAAVKFEKGMTNVATLLDTSTENMDAMGKKVKEISKRVPVDIEDLTGALYNVRSAGISAADAMGVLETSGKLAVAGLSTTEEAVDLLTSAINVYGDETHDSTKLADIMFKTVKAGKTTVAELAQGFGKVAAIAKEVGISIEDLSAATAVLTTGGIKASEAQTALKAMISNVLAPAGKAKVVAKELGLSFDLAALQADGLSGMLVNIAEKAGDDKQALADLFGSVEAANAIFALTSEEGGAALVKVLDDIEHGTSGLEEGFRKQTATAEKQFLMFKNNLNVVLADLGVKILPLLVSAMGYVIKAVDAWTEAFRFLSREWDDFTDGIVKVLPVIDKVSAATKFFTGGRRGEKNIPLVPFFQEGGVVPGPVGRPMPAIVHGGETIIPSDKPAGNVYNFNFEGAFIGDIDSFKRQIIDTLNRESELKALGGI